MKTSPSVSPPSLALPHGDDIGRQQHPALGLVFFARHGCGWFAIPDRKLSLCFAMLLVLLLDCSATQNPNIIQKKDTDP